ncbi:MAG: ATP-dependent helicase HrpB [Planctomycetota bacterium]
MTPLPIDEHLPRLTAALAAGRDVVLVAEPGAGKTTRVPPALLRADLLTHGHCVMLQPRRVAARLAASRIADENGWRLGDTVGYAVRFEKHLTATTPIRIVTEGVLARTVVADPLLEGIAVVVLDEFHERSLDADLTLAMLKEAQQLRDDLRIVVMSATLDADQVAGYLGEPEVLHVPGRTFPVNINYAGDSPRPIQHRISNKIEPLLQNDTGDVLVFLPGVREIEATLEAIRPIGRRFGYDCLPLHGSLTKEEQDEAVRGDGDRPRVICATNIAETSLTLPRVRVVVDSGQVRRAGFDTSRGVETLTTERISQASAEQRAGRAGRVAEGRCIRLWSAMTHKRLPAFDVPEIRRADVSRAALSVLAWGGDPQTLDWFEPPEPERLDAAMTLLDWLSAVEDGRLTRLGKAMQSIPLPPRPAALLALAPPELASDAALAAALLGEGADLPGSRTATMADLIAAFDARKLNPVVTQMVRRARDVLLWQTKGAARPDPKLALRRRGAHDDAGPPGPDSVAPTSSLEKLLLLAFPDRVCRRRSPETATLVNGGGVTLADSSAVRGDWFLALDARRGSFAKAQQAEARLVSPIEVEWLDELLPRHVVVETIAHWNDQKRAVEAIRRTRFGDLVLHEQQTGRFEDPWDAAKLLLEKCSPDDNAGLNFAYGDTSPDDVFIRLGFLENHLPHHLWPEDQLPGGLPEYEHVENACRLAASLGEPTEAKVRDLVREWVRAEIASSAWREVFEKHVPDALVVPSGSRIKLDWGHTSAEPGYVRGPILAVRIQELFGLAATPRVCGGAVPVTLHLLAPNMRTQQVTDDLASFWRNTYPQVRKDLRARYPKHDWPEDPMTATPRRGAKRRK